MIRKLLIVAILLALLFGAKGLWDALQQEPSAKDDLSGEWILSEMRAAGIYGESIETAQALVGREVIIRNGVLSSEFAPDCNIPPLKPVILKDDMETFGSSGGSWSELGLQPGNDRREYAVLMTELDCEAPFTKVVAQPLSGIYLLGHHEIYLLLTRR
ncbi:hypothetical protein [Sneathiella sp.]|uniref:hypothetical protein n=1 Tax=Sneathiella sp. TaxID=1964365 RepID=UPI0025F9536E|nr:hypothetical protein [Sneathiella sp.]